MKLTLNCLHQPRPPAAQPDPFRPSPSAHSSASSLSPLQKPRPVRCRSPRSKKLRRGWSSFCIWRGCVFLFFCFFLGGCFDGLVSLSVCLVLAFSFFSFSIWVSGPSFLCLALFWWYFLLSDCWEFSGCKKTHARLLARAPSHETQSRTAEAVLWRQRRHVGGLCLFAKTKLLWLEQMKVPTKTYVFMMYRKKNSKSSTSAKNTLFGHAQTNEPLAVKRSLKEPARAV